MTHIHEPAKQMAADLANAELLDPKISYGPLDFEGPRSATATALARICARTIERGARLARMEADMGRIDRLLAAVGRASVADAREASAIAARWRVEADPLEAEADNLISMDQSTRVIILAALKRGLELGAAK